MRLFAAASICAVARTIAGPIATMTRTVGCAIPSIRGAVGRTRTVASGVEYLLTALATEIRPVAGAGTYIVVTEALLNVRVVVADALAMCRIMLPRVCGAMVDVGAAIAPIEATAPIIAPAGYPPGCPEGDACRNQARADIRWVAEIIGRIGLIGPLTINHSRIVIRHIQRIRIGLLDHDGLLALLLSDRDLLLLVRR